MLQFYSKAMAFPPVNLPLITTPSPLPQGFQGVPYSQQLTEAGGVAPYTYALIGGSLDSGLSLSASGLIAGTPANAETDSFIVRITDAHGLSSQTHFNLTVAPSTLTFLTSSPLPTATPTVPTVSRPSKPRAACRPMRSVCSPRRALIPGLCRARVWSRVRHSPITRSSSAPRRDLSS